MDRPKSRCRQQVMHRMLLRSDHGEFIRRSERISQECRGFKETDCTETTENLTEEPEEYRDARRKAMRLLEHMDRTEKGLREKLRQAGFTSQAVDHALTYVEAYGYIDDERYARTYIAYRMDTKSRQKIIRELMGKGIDKKTAINAWEEEAALNMPDEKEILYRTIEKKYSPDTELDEKKMRRLYGYLVRRGFGYSDIADTLENMNIRLVHTYSDES